VLIYDFCRNIARKKLDSISRSMKDFDYTNLDKPEPIAQLETAHFPGMSL
jgi:hypothetical protein